MSHYRRPVQPGGTFFFTVVAFERRRVFAAERARATLRQAIETVHAGRPWNTVAVVLLPDHLHALWELPRGDDEFTTRWKLIKTRFTRAMIAQGWVTGPQSASRRRRQEHDLWQRRFWDHLIRGEEDLRRHIDYIHWNPVKHGYAARPADWPHSSIHRYIRQGILPPDWGCGPISIPDTIGHE